MEHKRGAEELRGPSTFEELEDWRNNNPVEIPKHIVEERELANARSLKEDMSFAEFTESTDHQRKRMNGTDDDSLMYKLDYFRSLESKPGDGIQAQILELEDSLRHCWCGSGKRARYCHIR